MTIESFIRKWVWFESRIYIGWLQWHLCEVRSFKTQLKWKYGTFRGFIHVGQGVVTYASPVEAFATGIKMESSD